MVRRSPSRLTSTAQLSIRVVASPSAPRAAPSARPSPARIIHGRDCGHGRGHGRGHGHGRAQDQGQGQSRTGSATRVTKTMTNASPAKVSFHADADADAGAMRCDAMRFLYTRLTVPMRGSRLARLDGARQRGSPKRDPHTQGYHPHPYSPPRLVSSTQTLGSCAAAAARPCSLFPPPLRCETISNAATSTMERVRWHHRPSPERRPRPSAPPI